MDVLGITDWEVLQRQPAETVDYRLELINKRAAFQEKQAERAGRGKGTAQRVSQPPPDVEYE